MIIGNWRSATKARQARRLIKVCSKYTLRLLNLNKKDLSIMVGLLTGHSPTGYHLKNLKRTQDDTCRFCKMEIETTEHLLCSCVALFNRRNQHLGCGLLRPAEVSSMDPIRVISYINCIMPNWEDVRS